MNSIKLEDADDDLKARVWTTVWGSDDDDSTCYHVQWGQSDGPELSFATVKRLSQTFFEAQKEKRQLKGIRFVANAPYGMWGLEDVVIIEF